MKDKFSLLFLIVVNGDSRQHGNVEDSSSTLQLFSFSFLFVTRQLYIRHGSRMRDNVT